MAVTESTRVMEISTPLGGDALMFHRMSTREALGRLSESELDLLSKRGDIGFSEILGKNVTVRLELPEGERFFNGYVTRFARAGTRGRYFLYQASVRPWLWFLTRTANCRMFQNMTVREIVEKVFKDHAIADYDFQLTHTYGKWEYCVQYRETDFNFVSRLMEKEGIYYYFKHQDSRHTMVLTDSCSKHAPSKGYERIPFIPAERMRPEHEAVSDFTLAHEVQPGAYALNDFYFEAPSVARLGEYKKPRQHELSKYEIFDYPGEYVTGSEGKRYAQTRLEEAHAQFEVGQGASNCRGLCTGSIFTLTGYPSGNQTTEYLVIGATHELQYNEYESMEGTSGSDYYCSFEVIRSNEQFRPPRVTPKPVVQGPQTALVVGPAGNEIYTDKFGRVKLKFHWDRESKADQDSSCWIRVSQNWAGKRWGAMFLPRIGQEVIVDFLEGDPDRPIITGRVYNGEAMPPYGLPDEMTKSTIKSYSSKGGGGFNEIRFEDKKGSEQLFLHAERNQDTRVKKDALEWIGNDRHLIVNNDQFEKVTGDKHLGVGGDQNEKVDGTVSLQAGADLQQKVGMKQALDAGQEIHLKAGMNVVIEAGLGLSLKVGGNFVHIDPAGVWINGVMVMINSGGSAGTGSGCKPASPTAAKPADDAKPGEKAAVPGAATASDRKGAAVAGTKHEPGKIGSMLAGVLKDAAKSGVPFCEKCEEAKRNAHDQ